MIRATFSGFSTAFSALQASQKRLDIVGQNLSNMNTQGYTRQQLETSSLNYCNPISRYMNGSQIAVGFGVSMDKVSQIRDPYLDAQYRAQINKSGYSDTLQSALDTLSKALDESSIDGIRTAFDDVQSTLTNLQDKGNDSVYESELRSRMQSLTNLLNDAARQIEAAEKAELSKLDGTGTSEQGAVDKVNDILRQIGNLNHQIKQNQVLGQQSLELLDERNSLLDELASYIPIEVTYFKDAEHDGKMTDPVSGNIVDAPKELYNYDSKGNIISRKEWPDDLKVELVYRDTTDPEADPYQRHRRHPGQQLWQAHPRGQRPLRPHGCFHPVHPCFFQRPDCQISLCHRYPACLRLHTGQPGYAWQERHRGPGCPWFFCPG